jgi:short-subunit dehydrogenase
MSKRPFHDKVFVITGSSSGIGREVALAVARSGGKSALGSRNIDHLKSTAYQVRDLNGDVLALSTDVTDPESINALVQQTITAWGKVDVLVSNAGQYIRAPILEMTMTDLERSMAVNFYGHVHAVQAVLPAMLQQKNGHIIFVASMDGKKATPPDAPYVSAKYALGGFGDILRQELRPRGISVTTLFPGRVDTPMISDLAVPWISAKISPEAVARAILRAVERRPAEVFLPPQVYLLYLTSVLSPRLSDWFVRTFKLEGRKA